MFIERIKELSSFGEIIPGSKDEKKLVNVIKKLFEKCDEVNVFPIEVLSYSEDHEITGKEKLDAVYLPYSPSIDFQGKITRSLKECNNNKAVVFILNNLYEINKYYRLAIKYDCAAVIFVTDKKRKFVIKTPPYLNLYPNPPPPIPAIIIPQNELSKLENEIVIKANANIKTSTGYIVEAIKNSKNDRKVYITAHHDHFFRGEHDNLLAVSLLPEFKSDLFELHLVSFTAEELGSLGYSSFSWSYGSRKFTNELIKDFDNVVFNINLDNIDPTNPIAKATPGLVNFMKNFGFNVNGSVEIYSDGYSFIKKGIPSITIEGYIENYHSIDDMINLNEEKSIIDLIININKLLKTNNIQINLNEIKDEIFSEAKHFSANLRSALVNIVDNLNYEVYREIIKIYGGILRMNNLYAEARLFHKLVALENLTDVTYIEGKPAIEISSLDNQYITEFKKEFEKEYITLLYEISEKFLQFS